MPMPRFQFTDEQLQLARELRAAGMGWGSIGRRLGCGEDTIHERIDPGFRERPRGQRNSGPRTFIPVERRPPKPEVMRALASVPRDTRSRVARWMGDPLPGRSALDQRGLR